MSIVKNEISEVTKGSNWKNRKTGRACIVLNSPTGFHSIVQLLHQTGRQSTKQMHYFLYDFEKIQIS